MDTNIPTQLQQEDPFKFKPSLLTRVFMEGGRNAEGMTPTVATVIQGGMSQVAAGSALAKVYLWLLILMISLYVAAKIMGSSALVPAFFKEDDANADFDNPEVVFKYRYIMMIRYTLVYILMVVLVHLFIIAICYMIIAIFAAAMAKDMSHVGSDISKAFSSRFWSFNGGNMSIYMYALGFVLFGLLAFQMVYFAAARSYFSYLAYPEYVDKEISTAEEHSTPMKYILNYSVIVFSSMLFLLGMFAMHNFTKPVAIGPLLMNILLLFIYATIYNLWIGFELEKKYVHMGVMFASAIAISLALQFMV